VLGLDACKADSAVGDRRYQAPGGEFASRVWFTRGPFTMDEPIMIGWRIGYVPR